MSRGRQKLPLRSVQPAGCSVCNGIRTVWWCLVSCLTELYVRLAWTGATRNIVAASFCCEIDCAISRFTNQACEW